MTVRSASRDTPPESRTSTSAGNVIGATGKPTGDRPSPQGFLGAGLPDILQELTQVLVGGLQELLTAEFDPDRFLQQLGGGESAFLDRSMEILGEIHLHPWHTPKHTHLQRA